jgi:Domain of unknown function (DUF4406)
VKIYLAGPMRGYPNANRVSFERAAMLLRHAHPPEELELFSPVEYNDTHGIPEGDIGPLAIDLAWIINQADGAVLLPGWEDSRGARAEVTAAIAVSKPVWRLETYLLYGPDLNWVLDIDTGLTAIEGRPYGV